MLLIKLHYMHISFFHVGVKNLLMLLAEMFRVVLCCNFMIIYIMANVQERTMLYRDWRRTIDSTLESHQ